MVNDLVSVADAIREISAHSGAKPSSLSKYVYELMRKHPPVLVDMHSGGRKLPTGTPRITRKSLDIYLETLKLTRPHGGTRKGGGQKKQAPEVQPSIQTLRLELENQLRLARETTAALQEQRRLATEQERELRHRLVDLEADLANKEGQAARLETDLTGLQSAFDSYGEIFTEHFGPQGPADL
jgi:hypothetical protein